MACDLVGAASWRVAPHLFQGGEAVGCGALGSSTTGMVCNIILIHLQWCDYCSLVSHSRICSECRV